MIEVRRAMADDGDAVGEIHAAAWAAAYAPFFDEQFAAREIKSRLTRWHDRISSGEGIVMLGSVDGRPLAMAWVMESATRSGLAEIYSFYGHPDGWGSGVAAALMEATLQVLRDDGFTRVHLWTLRDTAQSRRFYSKCGFAETGATQTRDFGDGQAMAQVEYERAC
ncbi:N-acetyltransferase family protein [Kribbella sp. CA-253562]|uniref:GNAT family N-acetyltransferase n=1 Tax=Kribbella sp. CA-253562 TaxID=3239942 RepID=UPI003D8C3E27